VGPGGLVEGDGVEKLPLGRPLTGCESFVGFCSESIFDLGSVGKVNIKLSANSRPYDNAQFIAGRNLKKSLAPEPGTNPSDLSDLK
jgi:hypothetical protein